MVTSMASRVSVSVTSQVVPTGRSVMVADSPSLSASCWGNPGNRSEGPGNAQLTSKRYGPGIGTGGTSSHTTALDTVSAPVSNSLITATGAGSLALIPTTAALSSPAMFDCPPWEFVSHTRHVAASGTNGPV